MSTMKLRGTSMKMLTREQGATVGPVEPGALDTSRLTPEQRQGHEDARAAIEARTAEIEANPKTARGPRVRIGDEPAAAAATPTKGAARKAAAKKATKKKAAARTRKLPPVEDDDEDDDDDEDGETAIESDEDVEKLADEIEQEVDELEQDAKELERAVDHAQAAEGEDDHGDAEPK